MPLAAPASHTHTHIQRYNGTHTHKHRCTDTCHTHTDKGRLSQMNSHMDLYTGGKTHTDTDNQQSVKELYTH